MNKYNIGFICAYFRIVNRPFGCILRRNLHIKSLVRLYFGTIYIYVWQFYCTSFKAHFSTIIMQNFLFITYTILKYLYFLKQEETSTE